MSNVLAAPSGTVSPLLDEPLYEIVNGERREVAAMGQFAGSIANLLAFHMNQFAFPRQLGFAYVEILFELTAGGQQRRPDVAFVTGHQPFVPGPFRDPPAWRTVPKLTVEVLSTTNTADEIEEKLGEYLEAGVEIVWVIYPRQQKIYVYQSPTQIQILQQGDELDGGNVLPGFRIKAADLFAVPHPVQ